MREQTKVWGRGVFDMATSKQAFREARTSCARQDAFHHAFPARRLENNAVIGQWDPKDEHIIIGANILSHHSQCSSSRRILASDRTEFASKHLIIGGSFGIKITSYPQMWFARLHRKKPGGRRRQMDRKSLRAQRLECARQRANIP